MSKFPPPKFLILEAYDAQVEMGNFLLTSAKGKITGTGVDLDNFMEGWSLNEF